MKRRFNYVATATGPNGQVTGRWTHPSVDGLLRIVDQAKPVSLVTVRAAYTSDGTFWGEGKGRVMATRERGKWVVDDRHDNLTEIVKEHGKAARDPALLGAFALGMASSVAGDMVYHRMSERKARDMRKRSSNVQEWIDTVLTMASHPVRSEGWNAANRTAEKLWNAMSVAEQNQAALALSRRRKRPAKARRDDGRDRREVILYDHSALYYMQHWHGGQRDPLYAISSRGGVNEAWVFQDALANVKADLRKAVKVGRGKYKLGKGTFTTTEINELRQIQYGLEEALGELR